MGGTLWAWGLNTYGQLGNGTTTASRQPIAVRNTQMTSANAIACGFSHSLAIDSNGKLWAWGLNDHGQLGDGTTTDRHEPTPVINTRLTSAIAIACGYCHNVAIDSNGKLWAWGQNDHGQLGDGTKTERHEPTPVVTTSMTSAATSVACGYYHSLVIDINHKLWAWGDNGWGQIGVARLSPDNLTPVAVTNTKLSFAKVIACGSYHSLAVDNNNKLWAWGNNSDRQLGDGTTDVLKTLPAAVIDTNLSFATGIAGGDNSSFAIDINGHLWSWGSNTSGQLGDGTTSLRSEPTAVINTNLVSVTKVAQAFYTTLAIDNNKKLWGWGLNNYGQVGNGNINTPILEPTAVINTSVPFADAIAVGNYHSLAIKGSPLQPVRGIPFPL